MGAEQKVVIITGASQGIGYALVKAYRDRNYRVVANSRSIKPTGDPDILAVAGDIALPETAQRIVAESLTHFGRIDALVNNAGFFMSRPFTEYSQDDFAKFIDTNVAGFFYVTQAAIAEMVRQGSGHVVNITTTLVDVADSKVPSVLASLTKGGVSSATKSLAIEFAGKGVRVNAVENQDALAKFHPLGRMGEICDIVDAVMYLESASFVTGELLHVDGGQSAGR
jgi:NAD(P)-dependent dehydrogenase (short-subunit alcohol dehydrogenase family)